ncbi:MAG: hypothetical protein Kow0091_19160 [Geminocystis sp.]
MNRDLASLVDALIFAKRITDFTQNMEEEDFANDLKTQTAVMYEISVFRRSNEENLHRIL